MSKTDKTKEELTQIVDDLSDKLAELEQLQGELEKAEGKLVASAHQWQTTFDAIGDSVCLLNTKHQILRCNRAMGTSFDKHPEEMVGKTCCEVVHGSALPIEGCPLRRMEQTLQKEVQVIPVGDSYVEVTVFPNLDANGVLIGAVHIVADVTEREQAEQQIVMANERLQYLLASTTAVIYTSKASDDYAATFITKNVETVTGYSYTDFLDNPSFWIDHVHPDDKKHVNTEVMKIFDKESHSHEYRFRCKDGRYIWILDDMKLVRDNSGKPFEIVGFWSDITERKQTEQKLRDAEANLQNTFDISPGLICAANATTGCFTECNPAVTGILGFTVKEFTSRPFMEYVHPDDRQRTVDEVEKQLKGSPVANFENRYVCKDGSYKWMAWQATAADENGKVHAVATDITERKQAEQALRESEHKLHLMSDHMSDYIMMLDTDFRIQFMNKAEAGMTTEQLIGTPLYTFVAPDEQPKVKGVLAKVMETGQPQTYETEYKRPDGTSVFYESVASPVTTDGKISSIVVSARDVTERKRFVTAMMASEKRQRAILTAVPDLIFIIKKDGTFADYIPSPIIKPFLHWRSVWDVKDTLGMKK